MSLDDKYEKILEGIIEVKTHQTSMREDIEQIKQQDIEQNKLLAEHIAGVKIQASRLDNEIHVREQSTEDQSSKIKEHYEEIDSRLKDVEFFPNFMKSAWKITKWAGVVAGSSVAISKLFGLW